MLLVFTDGSTLNNGKKGAVGGLGIYIAEVNINNEVISEYSYNDSVKDPTNQRCELLAISKSLDILEEKYKDYKGSIVIYTDSMYSINCITKWHKAWRNNGWKNVKGQDVKNKEIIQEILSKLKSCIIFNHIRSHQEKPDTDAFSILKWNGNNKADLLAKKLN